MNILKNTAVILIDMQSGFIDEIEANKRAEIISGQISILKECAEKDIPVIVLEFKTYGETIATRSWSYSLYFPTPPNAILS